MSPDTPAPSALPADSSEHISIGAFPEMFNPMCECESCGRERKRLFDKHIGPPPSPDKSAGGTPRTDVEVFYRDSQPVVEAGFARTLERETINRTAELAAVRNVTVARLERELAQAQQSLAEARTVAQQEKEHHDFYRNKVSDYMGAEIEWQKTFNSLRTKLKESRAQLKDLTDQFFARSQECAQLKQERDEARTQAGAQAMFGAVGGRLMTRIFEVADMSLPDATDVELQLVRLLDELKNLRAVLASPASSPSQEGGES